jgi:type IV pilus assembly protein PilY1
MNTSQIFDYIRNAIIIFCVAVASAQAAITDIDSAPMGTAAAVSASPNVMVMLDDSGSMDWDYLPDNAHNFSGYYGYNSSHCNGVYYNPNITYTVPVDSTGTPLNNGAPTSFTAAYKDGYNTSAGTVNLNTQFQGGSGSGSSGAPNFLGSAFYYNYTGAQTAGWQMNYYKTSGTFYTECKSGTVSGSSPVPTGTSPFTLTVLGSSANTAYITINMSSSSSTYVSGITVNGVQIMGAASTGCNTASCAAGNISAKIYSNGFSATSTNNVITITGPASAAGYTPVVTVTNNSSNYLTYTATSFPNDTNSAHLQNFANWYSYYSHRMLMMKSGLGLAFAPIGSSYRVGFMTMNNNVSPDFVDILPFAGGCAAGTGTCQKDKWYTKLYGSVAANSTPLREALSHVGQLYAHKFGTITNYTSTITVTCVACTSVNAGSFVVGTNYVIASVGTTSFTSIGASANTVGTIFTATGAGSGTGTATIATPTTATSVTVNGTETQNCTFTSSVCPAYSTPSAAAAGIANQINAMIQTDYGATVSGNVVTITGIAGSVGYAPVVANDGGGMTFTSTAFTASAGAAATLNGVTPLDPMQYSCQQDFVILSTDGFWNGSNTYDLNNNAVGQRDGNEPRPMNDGGTSATQSTTQVLQSTSQLKQLQSRTDTLQSQVLQLQQDVGTLQKQISRLTSQISQLQIKGTNSYKLKQTSQLQATQQRFSKCTNSASPWGTCTDLTFDCSGGTGDTNAPYCRAGSSSTNGVASCSVGSTTNPATTACNTVVTSPYAPASSCTANAIPNSSGNTTQCVNTNTWVGISTCTSGTNYSCQTVVTSAYAPAASCTANSTPDANGYTTQCSTTITSAYADAPSCTATVVPDVNGYTTQCQYSWTTAQSTPSCSVPAYVAGNYSNPTVYQNCQTVVTSTSTVVSPGSCTTTTSNGSGQSTQCAYSLGTWANTSSCTAVAQSTSSPYTVTTATDCQTINSTSCTPGTNGCSTATTSPTPVATCTSGTVSGLTTTCQTVTTGPTPVSSCTAASASSANNYTATTCAAGSSGQTGGDGKGTLADVAEYYYVTDLRDSSLGNCTGVGTVGGITYGPGGDVCLDDVPTSNLDKQTQQHMTTFTLGLGARGSMVFSPSYQSLTAACNPATDGDFCAIYTGVTASGATANDGSTICSWQTSGACNWPPPSSGSINNIDDLWHAAVNGRGAYYSATDPGTLATGLASTLAGISARLGSSAAATTSNPNVSAGNNFVFSSSFMSGDWTGEVTRESINLTTGALNCSGSPVCNPTIDWSAQAALDTLAAQTAGGGSRNIYTYNPSASTYTGDPALLNSGKLKSFIWANMTATEQGYLNNISGLSQYTSLTSAQQTAAAGANLLSYLRGDTSNYGTYYRARTHILGDVVDSKIAYVGQPSYSYGDTNYSAFASTVQRSSMVYVGANDGMLHAFNAGGATITPGDGSGSEAWAYIPDLVEPNLYLLADVSYATQHHFFVDGSPIVGDICPNAPTSTCSASPTGTNFSGSWRTILVGGLNDGGSGYYALDVTDPTNPQALWEFTDPNMGYSFGNPQITKLANGTWVVLLTSGYNNVPAPNGPQSTGDGVGRLYVLNAYTGALIRTISTGVGSAGTPSGLARISARVDNPSSDNTALEVYGGDLLGNVWRFDINNNVGSSSVPYEAQLITTLKDSSGNVQPITTKPEVGIVSNQVVVFVGTGKFLGTSDLTNTLVQTMYAIKDPLTVSTTASPATAIYSSPQGSTCSLTTPTNCFVQQTAVDTTCPSGSPATICSAGYPVRTGSNNPVSFSTQNGWYINFPDSGERDNTDPILALGTLGFTTNTPSTANACSVGGYSYSWFLNYSTGAAVSTSTTGVISVELGSHNSGGGINSSAFGNSPTYYTLPNGTVMELTTLSSGGSSLNQPPVSGGGGSTRRTSWRELILQ